MTGATAALASCENAFAPQDATIVVRVSGVPIDNVAAVTAFVRDPLPPHNLLRERVPVGGSVAFDNLGVGYRIEAGVTDLGDYRCRLTGAPGTTPDSSYFRTAETTPVTVTFSVHCLSGTLVLEVSGLLPGDVADVLLDSTIPGGYRRLSGLASGASTTIAVEAASIDIQPDAVVGSDGFTYDAPAQTVRVVSGDTTTVAIVYAVRPQNQVQITLNVVGSPADPGIVLQAFLQPVTPGAARSSAPVTIGDALTVANLPLGADYDIGLEGLDAFACHVRDAPDGYVVSGGTVTARVTTRAYDQRERFALSCRIGLLDLEVSGLPPGATAPVHLETALDTVTVMVGNGITRANVLPNWTHIDPRPVVAPDGSLYDAAFLLVFVSAGQVVTASLAYTTAPICPVERPIAWYPFNGDTKDYSGNGLDAVPGGTVPATDRSGRLGYARGFDGVDDALELGDNFNGLALPFSVAAWLYQPAAARSEFRSIFVTDDAPGVYAGIWLQTEPGGTPQITFADGGPVGAGTRRTLSGDAPIPADEWVHLAATVRGPADMTLYVNGQAVPATYSGTGGPLQHTSAPARIGRMTTVAANRPWLGEIDELRVYACSLGPGDVGTLRTWYSF